jgi:phosphomannomutase / phosphoglucomutase
MAKINERRARLFGTNGVRGIFGKDLTLESVIDLSHSLATYFQKGPLVVGNDGRKSSPILSRVVCSTLNSANLNVHNARLIPTPCLQYATKYLGYWGGIMITASHNPPQYNGIKPIAHDGIEISREDELKVEDIYFSKKFLKRDGLGKEFITEVILDSYIEAVLKLVDVNKIKERKFKIVVDIGNGAQATVAPFLFQKLGCNVLTINGNLDGDFIGRGPEPIPEKLGTLANMVKGINADLGVAFDGDGDRSIFCDERGVVHWGDTTGTLIVQHLIRSKHKGAEIVCPINTTMALAVVAKNEGSNVTYTKVGSVEVSREMFKRKSFIGLEDNGGFMYGKLNEVRDGALTTALVLDMLAANKERLSQLVYSLPRIFQYKSKFECPTREIADNIIDACLKHGNLLKLETLDGAKMWVDDETWIMVRQSGTEPLIRIYAESTDKSLLDSKVSEYTRLIKSKIEDDK